VCERGELQAALPIRLDPGHPLATQAQVLKRRQHGGVRFLPNEDRDLGSAVQTPGLDIPFGTIQDRVPCRGETDGVTEPRSGRKPKARLGWQTKEVQEPATGDLLDSGRR